MYELDKSRFGAFVAQLRREKGWTQRQLAERLFVSDKAVSKWETGAGLPDTALLVPLSELPGYCDSERIGAYYDGPFRMNLPGLALNNRNWPRIVRTCRAWCCRCTWARKGMDESKKYDAAGPPQGGLLPFTNRKRKLQIFFYFCS